MSNIIAWKKLALDDKDLISSYLKEYAIVTSDHNFTNLWMWDHCRRYHHSIVESFLCIHFEDEGKSKMLMPVGSGNIRLLLERLLQDAASRGVPLVIRAIGEGQLQAFQEAFPGKFQCHPEEERFDYLYSFDDLLHLPGNRFQTKRNLIYKFEHHYKFEYKSIDASLIPQVIAMQERWFREEENPPKTIENEHHGTLTVLRDFQRLDVFGGAIIADDGVVAYSIAERIGEDRLLVHIEKAFKDHKGAYQVMNQQLLQHVFPPARIVNREEDLGVSSLAQAKESYHPIDMVKKYCLEAVH